MRRWAAVSPHKRSGALFSEDLCLVPFFLDRGEQGRRICVSRNHGLLVLEVDVGRFDARHLLPRLGHGGNAVHDAEGHAL